MHTVFRQIKNIVGEVDLYLENLEKVAALFELGIKDYFEDKFDSFEERCADIRKLETENDHLRTKIKKTLYTDLLIPDARGDVLGLVETLDDVLGVAEHVFVQLSIEKPLIYPFIKDDFISLAQAASRTVEELVVASRSFFRDPARVQDHISKIHFWEHEADKLEEKIKRRTFSSDEIESFSRKIHIRYFAERISLFADKAEDVGERLEVYAIKRAL